MKSKIVIVAVTGFFLGVVFGYGVAKFSAGGAPSLHAEMNVTDGLRTFKKKSHPKPPVDDKKNRLPKEIRSGGKLITNVSANKGRSLLPNIIADGANGLYVAWVDRESGETKLRIEKKSDGKWEEIDTSQLFDGMVLFPAIATDSKHNLHVAFRGKKSNDHSIYYTKRTGNVWLKPEKISEGSLNAYTPKIAIDGRDNIHVVWHSAEGHLADSFHRAKVGGEWSELYKFTPTKNYESVWLPRIAVDSTNNVHVVFYTVGKAKTSVYHVQKEQGGSWGAYENISGDFKFPIIPNVALDSKGSPHVIWLSGERDDQDIFYTYRVDGKWSSPVNLTNTGRRSLDPAFVMDENNRAHIVWSEAVNKQKTDLYYISGSENKWKAPLKLIETENSCRAPNILVDQNHFLNVVWFEGKNNYETDILYASIDGSTIR